MGVVLEAEDPVVGRPVAIKLATLLTQDTARARFQREAQLLAEIEHPHVVKVYEAGVAEGIPYMVMEVVRGGSLEDSPPEGDPTELFLQAAEALEELHARGLVHRDVKPGNLLLDGERLVLADFGVVHAPDRTQLTATGAVPGTLGFLAPEAFQGASPTPAWDWWAMGVSIYAVLEDKLPYGKDQISSFYGGYVPPPRPWKKADPGSPAARLARAWMSSNPQARPAGREAARRAAYEVTAETAPITAPLADALAAPADAGAPGAPDESDAHRPPTDTDPAQSKLPWPVLLAGSLAVGLASFFASGPGPGPTDTPAPGPQVPASEEAPRFPAVDAARAATTGEARAALVDPDPWVWGRALSGPPFGAALALWRDPRAADALRALDGDLQGLDRPALAAPFLEHEEVDTLPDLTILNSWSGFRDMWPERTPPHLAGALDALGDALSAYQALEADLKVVAAGGEPSETYPFPEVRGSLFPVEGWELVDESLESDPTVRAAARYWFEPAASAYRRCLAGLARSMEEEPDTAELAAAVGVTLTGAVRRVFWSWLARADPDGLTGGPPRGRGGHALQAAILLRQAWMYRRGRVSPPPGHRDRTWATAREALTATSNSRPGKWLAAITLERLAEGVVAGEEPRDLASLADEHVLRILDGPNRPLAADCLAGIMRAWDRLPELEPLQPARAAAAARFFEEDPAAMGRHRKNLEKWVARLRQAAGP
jgi:serine/threonine protein kinase